MISILESASLSCFETKLAKGSSSSLSTPSVALGIDVSLFVDSRVVGATDGVDLAVGADLVAHDPHLDAVLVEVVLAD